MVTQNFKPSKWRYLKKATFDADLNFRSLERKTGVSNSALSSYHNLKQLPSLRTFMRLAVVLNVPLHELIYSNPMVLSEIGFREESLS